MANLVDADLLVVLTGTDGLYSADLSTDLNATLIAEVDQVDARIGRHRGWWFRSPSGRRCPRRIGRESHPRISRSRLSSGTGEMRASPGFQGHTGERGIRGIRQGGTDLPGAG